MSGPWGPLLEEAAHEEGVSMTLFHVLFVKVSKTH